MRVGKVVEAVNKEGSDKLIRLVVDFSRKNKGDQGNGGDKGSGGEDPLADEEVFFGVGFEKRSNGGDDRRNTQRGELIFIELFCKRGAVVGVAEVATHAEFASVD